MLSPMRLEHYQFTELVVRTKQPGQGPSDEVKWSISTNHGRNATKPSFTLGARLQLEFLEDSPSPFSEILVTIEGNFVFPDNMPDEIIRRFYPTVAMANLLGIVRGSLAQSTALFKGGPFRLPLFDLTKITLLNEEAERKLFPAAHTELTPKAKAPKAPRKPSKRKAAPRKG